MTLLVLQPPITTCTMDRTVIALHTAVPHHMQVDLSELRAAISIACRLGFASRLPNPRDTTGGRQSGGAHQSVHVAYVISCSSAGHLCFQQLGFKCIAGTCSPYLSRRP